MVRKRRKRKASRWASPSGLAFLDILCCGLGAAVLLLLIVRHEPPYESEGRETREMVSLMVSQLTQKISNVEAENNTRREEVLGLEKNLHLERRRNQRSASESSSSVQNTLGLVQTLGEEEARGEILRSKIKNLQASIDKSQSGIQESVSRYGLEGIQLTGKDRVVVALDVSASMLHEELVGIIRLRVSNSSKQQLAAKWVQAKNALKWGVEQIDSQSRFQIFLFSERVEQLVNISPPKFSVGDPKWLRKASQTGKKESLDFRLMDKLPTGGTNLSALFQKISQLQPKPKHILLITDGLPNQINVKNRNRISGCNTKDARTSGLLTGECRTHVAIDSISLLGSSLANIPVDVILLPLQGDPGAVRFYSLVTAQSGGRLLVPTSDWLN